MSLYVIEVYKAKEVTHMYRVKGHYMYRSKCLISLLHLPPQTMIQDHQTWSEELLNLASYRMFRDKGQRSQKGHRGN